VQIPSLGRQEGTREGKCQCAACWAHGQAQGRYPAAGPRGNLGSLPPRDSRFPQALRRRVAAVAGRSGPW